MVIYLTRDEIIVIHDRIIARTGGLEGVRLDGELILLETLPAQTAFGQELYPDIHSKAAVYIRKINSGHVFNDGNKRTSFAIAAEFMERNGFILEPPPYGGMESVQMFMEAIATQEKNITFDDIKNWIIKYSRKLN